MSKFDFANAYEVEVTDENFLKVKETLSRIGMKGKGKSLTQLAYILYKQDRYFIIHYKQLQHLDGAENEMNAGDTDDLKLITSILWNWGMYKCQDPKPLYTCDHPLNKQVKVIPHKEIYKWRITSPYNIGEKHE